jgi:hypothetical protein
MNPNRSFVAVGRNISMLTNEDAIRKQQLNPDSLLVVAKTMKQFHELNEIYATCLCDKRFNGTKLLREYLKKVLTWVLF